MTSTQHPIDHTSRGVINLAKRYAEVRGFEGRPGGWIYDKAGKPVAHGWTAFAQQLVIRCRIVRLDSGRLAINWMADHR